jgi:tetratricopeptide (TPR) repeat protein
MALRLTEANRRTARTRRRVVVAVLIAGLAVGAVLTWRRHRADQLSVGRKEFVIFLLGGSTAAGEPYGGYTDLGQMVRWMFGGSIGGRPIRVKNLGRPGQAAAKALEDATAIASAIAKHPPPQRSAVAFLYPGNNEFLRFDQEHDLSKGTRPLFDEPTTTAAERAQTLREYGESLEAIIRTLQQVDVPVLVSTTAVNLQWDPNRSVLADPGHAAEVRARLEHGDALRASGDEAGARAEYLAVLALEPHFALASFRAAESMERLGQFEDARRYYLDAVEFDGNPYRETPTERQLLLAIAQKTGTPVIDAEKVLADASPGRIAGFNLFWDNCHPTLEGYLRIAAAFAEAVDTTFGAHRTRLTPDVAAYERELGWGPDKQARILASRGAYCYRAATLSPEPALRLRRAETLLTQALELQPKNADIVASRAVLAAMEGDVKGSMAYWKQAWSLDAKLTAKRKRDPRVREILSRVGIPDTPPDAW